MGGVKSINPINPNDLDALARTAYGEARGEGDAARVGVISSVLNRAETGTFPGRASVAAVCKAPYQYSCWNENDPNREVIRTADARDPSFAACLGLALAALRGEVPDNTNGALYYHDVSIAGPPPGWGAVHLTARHGRLKFYAPGHPAASA